ncbi:hypothetical protein KY330_00445 [Candidatus Woesearchaeota archaeon]|nr:hypothetical protein [Candidatus Woesearchaeota archaeon]
MKSLSMLSMLFILIGVVLTLESFNIVEGVSVHWPGLLLLIGTGFLVLFMERKNDAALVWIGSFLVFLSAFFYYLNYTSWKSLARLWPVFLGIVGLSFFCVNVFIKKKVYAYLSVIFVFLFVALFIVFTVSLRLWPLSLVFFGISLLIIDYFK